ncbi:MAG: 3-mercaptopyruvate sulfurtransferase [Novosphingobium sp.]|nr:MAG: 3-mercaptopyruvate sulfurtransferase [Novosphingobium sp.]
MDSLVSTEWLAHEMGASDLRIVDASYHLPDAARDARADYEAGHIPGAVFLNLAELVDPASPIDNTLPSAEKFASRMQELGLGDGSRIVLYDDSAIRTSARAWYMLRQVFGAHHVAVLDGGLAKWKAEGRTIESGRNALRARHFTAWSDAKRLRTKDDVLANLRHGEEQLVDARGAPRFTGEEQESRPGLASGHIPGSRNVPYKALFNADGTYKDKTALTAVFEEAGVDLDRPIIATCGSGMTACAVAFALHLLGRDKVSLYDGSWSEWGADPATPKATGQA